ncbi:UTRA domain-containing protein [Streptomyces olivaceoviridis]|uniref:UTRA domain-containing protein n=1 Tax=Streptomyces olivaceoviridis TaxID=1921 RepID=UPI00379711B8
MHSGSPPGPTRPPACGLAGGRPARAIGAGGGGGRAPHDTVIRLERLRSDGDDPLVYSVASIVRDAIPGPVRHFDWSGSLSDMLAAHGHPPVSSAARLSAVELPEDVQRRYSLGGFGPWLLISETVITPAGRPVLYAEDYHRGDAFAFNVLRR